MGIKDVSLVFDHISPNGFESGTSVSGKVKFVTDKPVRMKNITLIFQGKATALFYTHQIQWFKNDHTGWRDGSVLGFGSVFDINWNSIYFHRRLSDRKCFRSEQLFMSSVQQLAGETCLHLGVTEYPFQFQLPHNIPSTFENKVKVSHGQIRYKIKVKWSQSGFLAPSDTYKVELPVVVPDSFRCFQSKDPKLLEPRVYHDVRPFSVLFSSSDPITMVIKLPRSVVVTGETLQVDIKIDNSSQVNIDTVSVRFIQRCVWLGKYTSYKNVKIEDTILYEVNYNGVLAKTYKSWTQPIPINAEPTVYIEPCTIIKLFHVIMVEVVPSGLYNKIKMVAPVEVCFDGEKKLSEEKVPVLPTSESDCREFDSSEPPPYAEPPPYYAVASMSTNNLS